MIYTDEQLIDKIKDMIEKFEDEVVEFKHTAYSKAVFGKGAVEAAKFLAGKPAGRYEMRDVITAVCGL